MLQSVLDGMSTENVLFMGENYLTGILYYLEEILACCEFAINNLKRDDYETVFTDYVNSRDTGEYRGLVFNIGGELKNISESKIN